MNAAHQKQNDRRVSHLKSFIARFGHGAKNLAKQAQSRMKMLQKIQDEPCEVHHQPTKPPPAEQTRPPTWPTTHLTYLS